MARVAKKYNRRRTPYKRSRKNFKSRSTGYRRGARKRFGGSAKRRFTHKPRWSKKVGSAGGMKLTKLMGEVGSSSYRQPMRSKIPRGFKRLIAPRYVTWTCAKTFGSTAGMQTVDFLPLWQTSTVAPTVLTNQITSILSTPSIQTLMSQVVVDDPAIATTSQGYNTTKFWVDYIRITLRMRNQSNRPLSIVIRDVTPRRANVGNSGPERDWDLGYTDMQSTGVTVPTGYSKWYQVPGSSPSRSPRFNENWKILHTASFTLHEGKEHVHTLFLSPKYPMSPEMYQDPATPVYWHRGLSVMSMVQISGGIIHDSVDSNVTISSGKLDVVASGIAKIGTIQKNRSLFMNLSGLDTNIGGTELAMDDETHQSVATVQA